MLTISTQERPRLMTLVMAGTLTGLWVRALEQYWRELKASADTKDFLVDLTGVTRVDSDGGSLLASIEHDGATVLFSQALMKRLIELSKGRERKTEAA